MPIIKMLFIKQLKQDSLTTQQFFQMSSISKKDNIKSSSRTYFEVSEVLLKVFLNFTY